MLGILLSGKFVKKLLIWLGNIINWLFGLFLLLVILVINLIGVIFVEVVSLVVL